MMWFTRSCTIAIILLVAPAAHARELGLLTTGGDILHLRDLPPETAAAVGFTSLGYRYNVFGIYGLDFWRWGGEHVVYTSDTDVSSRDASDAASGQLVLERWTFAPATGEVLARLGGAGVPWMYRCPPGLLLILALIELQLVVRRRRSARTVLGVGGALLVIALVLYGQGVDQAFVIPLVLGVHHVGAAWFAIRRQRGDASGDDAVDNAHDEPHVAPPPGTSAASRPREQPPNVETDPFRAPPQPAPIVVERPPTPASSTSIVAEADASPHASFASLRGYAITIFTGTP
jgi:hypothetical protein